MMNNVKTVDISGEAPYSIPFTQFMRPFGRATPVKHMTMCVETAKKAEEILQAGFQFHCEHLTTSDVSFTITDEFADHAMRVCPNGPAVPELIIDMIATFDIGKAKAYSETMEADVDVNGDGGNDGEAA